MAKVFQVDTGGTLTTNLIDYYKLEDGTDYWGGYNLTNVGGVTFEAGKVNNAAQYGTAQDRDLRTLQTLGINGGSISISVWVNITTAPDNNLSQSIVEQFNTAK